jgi:hypothetical protein
MFSSSGSLTASIITESKPASIHFLTEEKE